MKRLSFLNLWYRVFVYKYIVELNVFLFCCGENTLKCTLKFSSIQYIVTN